VEFGRTNFWTFSLLGYAEWPYPAGWVIAANRPELEPWWGAREPVLLLASGGLVVAGLFLVWAALAMIYAGPVWLLAFYANRDLRLKECWRLANAALLPGAILAALGFFCFGAGWFDLVTLAFFLGVHVVVGWAYLPVSVLFLARVPGAAPRNPFRTRAK
jgi:hypothetical protein